MQNCQRCRTKEAIFACMECELSRYLCEDCDKYIHNLPGKQSHKRVTISDEKKIPLKQKSNNSIEEN